MFVYCVTMYSQILVEKSYATKDRTLGGDAAIIKTIYEVKGEKSYTTFEAEIPSAGYYYVKIRSLYNTTSGLYNLNINNKYQYNSVPVYSYGIRGEKDTNHIYNSFTCYCNGDPRLWVEEGSLPGYVTAYNDNYNDCTDFNWGNNARVLRQYSNNLNAIHLTSGSSYYSISYCDHRYFL